MPKALYFAAKDSDADGVELWRLASDGTLSVTNLNPAGTSDAWIVAEFNGELYFKADDGTHGRALWKVRADGTTALVAPKPWVEFVPFNNELSCNADDGVH